MYGGVDLNHTALTDLQNRLTKVEGSVGQVQDAVQEKYKNVPVKGLEIDCKHGVKSTVVSVNGKGVFFLAKYWVTRGYKGATLTVEIDGKKVNLVNKSSDSATLMLATTESFFFEANGNYINPFQRNVLIKNGEDYSYDAFGFSKSPIIYDEELFIKPSITIPLNVTVDAAPIGRKNAYKFESSFKVTIDESMISPEYSYPSSVYILYLVE